MKRYGFASISLIGSLWSLGPTAAPPTPPRRPTLISGQSPAPQRSLLRRAAPHSSCCACGACTGGAPRAAHAADGWPVATSVSRPPPGLRTLVSISKGGDKKQERPNTRSVGAKSSLNVQKGIAGLDRLHHVREAGSGAHGRSACTPREVLSTELRLPCNAQRLPDVRHRVTRVRRREIAAWARTSHQRHHFASFWKAIGASTTAPSANSRDGRSAAVLGDTNLGVPGIQAQVARFAVSFGGEMEAVRG